MENHSQRFWRWALAIGFLFIVLLALLVISGLKNSAMIDDPRFVATRGRSETISEKATIKEQLLLVARRTLRKFSNPISYSFGASATSPCSIQGLLNQCTEVTGVRYLIAKEVVTASVPFGHTNVMNGTEWTAAFTHAIQNNQPQWWDAETKTFRKENLVLLTNDAQTVLVLPQRMAQEFLDKKAK